jgi:hypothetical protein
MVLVVTGLGVAPVDAAESLDNLPDPTRPGGGAGGGVVATQGFVLQSTTISPRLRQAVINGQRVMVGEKIGGATVADIQSFEVVLKRDGRDIVLRLTPSLAKQRQ